MRFDWAQSQRSQWFVRYALDNYTTNNALVQQATLPSTGATDALQLSEWSHQQHLHLQPIWVGTFTFGTSYLHGTADRNRISRIRAGFSLQLHLEDHLRFRNLRRQPVRHRHHGISGHSQPGEISVPLRCQRLDWQARAQVRCRLHSRAGAEWRLSRPGGNPLRSHRESDLLPDQSRLSSRRS